MKLRSHQLDSLVAMQQCDKGQIIVPTGGGKTMCMIEDAQYRFDMNAYQKLLLLLLLVSYLQISYQQIFLSISQM